MCICKTEQGDEQACSIWSKTGAHQQKDAMFESSAHSCMAGSAPVPERLLFVQLKPRCAGMHLHDGLYHDYISAVRST